jgi:hypothetical protein
MRSMSQYCLAAASQTPSFIADRDVTPEDLEKERKASAERRRKQFDSLRREKPIPDATEVRTLSRAQKIKLRDDDFVAPRE